MQACDLNVESAGPLGVLVLSNEADSGVELYGGML